MSALEDLFDEFLPEAPPVKKTISIPLGKLIKPTPRMNSELNLVEEPGNTLPSLPGDSDEVIRLKDYILESDFAGYRSRLALITLDDSRESNFLLASLLTTCYENQIAEGAHETLSHWDEEVPFAEGGESTYGTLTRCLLISVIEPDVLRWLFRLHETQTFYTYARRLLAPQFMNYNALMGYAITRLVDTYGTQDLEELYALVEDATTLGCESMVNALKEYLSAQVLAPVERSAWILPSEELRDWRDRVYEIDAAFESVDDPERLRLLREDEELARICGPSNGPLELSYSMSETCYDMGCCRMLTCTCYINCDEEEADDDTVIGEGDRAWFSGKCEQCLSEIPRYWYAARRPGLRRSWKNNFCSRDCMLISVDAKRESVMGSFEAEGDEDRDEYDETYELQAKINEKMDELTRVGVYDRVEDEE